ncbi:hypothetical protein NN6n1_24980 [Shinella zoogloeoides]
MADRGDEAGLVEAIRDEAALGMAQAKLLVDGFEGHGSLPLLLSGFDCTETGWIKDENGRPHFSGRPPETVKAEKTYWNA